MESIASSEMHRNKAQLWFAKYGEKYIQKWVLHDEAVDLMVLKVQKFAMEDHYARLYGPRVMAKKSVMASTRARSPSGWTWSSLIKCWPRWRAPLVKRVPRFGLCRGVRPP